MKCEMCRDQEALVHVTQVVDGKVKKLHLCEACAVNGLTSGTRRADRHTAGRGLRSRRRARRPRPRRTGPASIARCGFLISGRPRGWAVLSVTIRLPGAGADTEHAPRSACRQVACADGSCRKQAEQAGLRKALAAAVAAENYEEAARVRDLIRLSGGAPQPTRLKT